MINRSSDALTIQRLYAHFAATQQVQVHNVFPSLTMHLIQMYDEGLIVLLQERSIRLFHKEVVLGHELDIASVAGGGYRVSVPPYTLYQALTLLRDLAG